MDRRVVVPLAVAGVALLFVALSAGALDPLLTTDGYDPTTPTGPNATATSPHPDYNHTTVTVVDAETNATLGEVRVALAQTWREKYTGLSKTDSLPENRGMLFPYDEPGNHTYVMRGMDFGIDIVYVDADGTITRIHHAEEPPEGADGEQYKYPGYGQYVLEVNYEWTTRHNVTEGDKVYVAGYDAAG
ncbi:DUF192 domain-containing protein [Halorarius halobius]|uniref:DUF192 domain-containing protein n=1 Tax=Halorarius halobius TaxID=2962671 RepID=UPI0020CED438|nr:DUF192 domain-containing protein [Halorarius halobius]